MNDLAYPRKTDEMGFANPIAERESNPVPCPFVMKGCAVVKTALTYTKVSINTLVQWIRPLASGLIAQVASSSIQKRRIAHDR